MGPGGWVALAQSHYLKKHLLTAFVAARGQRMCVQLWACKLKRAAAAAAAFAKAVWLRPQRLLTENGLTLHAVCTPLGTRPTARSRSVSGRLSVSILQPPMSLSPELPPLRLHEHTRRDRVNIA